MTWWQRSPPASSSQADENDDEREVRAAFERGDHGEVLSLLMQAHGRAIYRFCCQMVGDDLGEDAHQMTFVQAFESLSRFRGQASFRTWLFSIARHRCLDASKSGKRRDRRFHPLEEGVDHEDSTAGAAEVMAARERARWLEECIAALPSEMRETILLRFQQELSYEEIAAVLGERAATLRVRVSRALPRLRGCLRLRGGAP